MLSKSWLGGARRASGVFTLNYYYSVVVQAFRPARAADLKVHTTSTDSSSASSMFRTVNCTLAAPGS